METQSVDVLVVGGGTGGTAAAIQAARRGAKTLLVSEFPWLGGMLTAAGVTAPDGNELLPYQTGLWGAFLQALQQRQPQGLEHAWVSFFTYDPRIGAAIFADWVQALPNLQWRWGQTPQEVLRNGDRVVGVRFPDLTVQAQITLDGTELGDLLALGEIPYRWGWELQSEWQEPSAPVENSVLTATYPVQAPTWVVVMRDYGEEMAPEIPLPPIDTSDRFVGAWDRYGGEQFLNYGRLPQNHFMINWPIHGNDYGDQLQRLVGSAAERQEFWQSALWHSQCFARTIQAQLGQRYGLATDVFPQVPGQIGGGAFALHPYYRESRRVQGLTTVREQDLLPFPQGHVAPLPLNPQGQVDAIAIGNYVNDHHYPSGDIALAPKSMRWGGRWTGTPFTIPYRALIPAAVDGLMCCDKNISVTHMANGATRLQPLVLGIGQAAGMAAALCVEQGCQPRELNVRTLQEALLHGATPDEQSLSSAPTSVIPLLNRSLHDPDWMTQQIHYLDHPGTYPIDGQTSGNPHPVVVSLSTEPSERFSGKFQCLDKQSYQLTLTAPPRYAGKTVALVTLDPWVNQQMLALASDTECDFAGTFNQAGNWLRVTQVIGVNGAALS